MCVCVCVVRRGLRRVNLSLYFPPRQKVGLSSLCVEVASWAAASRSGSSLPISVACLAKADWLPNSQRQSGDESALTRWSQLRVHQLTAQVLREMETQQITFRPLQKERGRREGEIKQEEERVQNGFWTLETFLRDKWESWTALVCVGVNVSCQCDGSYSLTRMGCQRQKKKKHTIVFGVSCL